jgi:DNA-binding NarL/FixJ family response regulator
MEQQMIRVVIADDFSAMLKIMRQLIERAGDMDWMGDATRADQVIALLEGSQPDVVVMNDYIPPLNSVQVIEKLRAAGFQQPILVVSMHNESDLVHGALQAGATGFILKTELMNEFILAIRAVHRGETYLSPQIATTLAGD